MMTNVEYWYVLYWIIYQRVEERNCIKMHQSRCEEVYKVGVDDKMKALQIDLKEVKGKSFLVVRFPQQPGAVYIPVDGKVAMFDEPKVFVDAREEQVQLREQREQERLDRIQRDEEFAKEMAVERAKMEQELAKKAQKLGAKYSEPKKATLKIEPDEPLVMHDYAAKEEEFQKMHKSHPYTGESGVDATLQMMHKEEMKKKAKKGKKGD